MSIPGFASAAATSDFANRYRNRYRQRAYRLLGGTGLTVSQIGFGTYRCQQNNDIHFQALQQAIHKGCNIIDTSANYMDGAAESLIGDVLNQEVVWGDLQREEIVLVSKVGYIQGENMEIVRQREMEKRSFPDIVQYAPGVWHCIHPSFIRDQISRSLSRMQVDVLDVYLLHNPEYYLLDVAKKSGAVSHNILEEFYRRIQQSFLEMEKLAEEGLIRFYGISSNTFPVSAERPDFVSLSRVWEVYQSVCAEKGISPGEGHFAVIQFPFNWLEKEAFTLKNNSYQGKLLTVLELARELNLSVLTNRPLNAFKDHQMFRLARYGAGAVQDYNREFEKALERLGEIEEIILQTIREEGIDASLQDKINLSDVFRNVETLRRLNTQALDISQLNQLMVNYFLPLFSLGEKVLLSKISMENREKTSATLAACLRYFNLAATALKNKIDQQNYHRLKFLEDQFNRQYNHLSATLGFSQKALKVVADTPGVDVVLNGMRTPQYVEDSLGVMGLEEIDPVKLLR